MTGSHIYVPRVLTDTAMRAVAELGHPFVVGAEETLPREALLRDAAGAMAVICTVTERIDAEFLDAAGPSLRVVANTAVGYDNIDVPAATERGVTVTNTPGVLDGATADLTMALILTASRRVAEGDRFLRSRTPWVWGPRMMLGLDISADATLGIIGYGRIGRAVARRARAFDMHIIATPTRAPIEPQDAATEFVDLPTLLQRSDVVTVHCPLRPDTHHLIDADALKLMKPSAILINTARGEVVDQEALIDALRSGTIAGAGLDVFEGEPHVDPRLLELDNAVLTPHIGSAGTKTRERMCQLAVRNVEAVLAGHPAITPVN
jgi:lactate dehydrogenase-like 2-hydroxyacid dehydrogenase